MSRVRKITFEIDDDPTVPKSWDYLVLRILLELEDGRRVHTKEVWPANDFESRLERMFKNALAAFQAMEKNDFKEDTT